MSVTKISIITDIEEEKRKSNDASCRKVYLPGAEILEKAFDDLQRKRSRKIKIDVT